jgi:peroxiredoxin
VSFDSPSANQAFADAEGFTFELWTDDDRTLALYYGAIDSPSASYANRVTRILDAEGVLLVEYDDVSFGTNPQEVLEDCEQLFGSGG